MNLINHTNKKRKEFFAQRRRGHGEVRIWKRKRRKWRRDAMKKKEKNINHESS
jgi:hypothetical protein